jgi:DHA1 family multidrug resistance protein-like MFS transporter
MRRRGLLVLLGCVFVAMIGFGITLPVLPFYIERLALRGRASPADVAMQVGLLTAVYPLLQLVFAPLWGYWSDTLGRKRLVLIGIGGAAATQLLFAVANSLGLLYAARVVGGALSSAIFPAATAYVADSTSDDERGRGMAWLGTAVSLGVVVGPALGGVLARAAWWPDDPGTSAIVFGFAAPFLAAAALALAALAAAAVWLPESRLPAPAANVSARGSTPPAAPRGFLRVLLGLAFAGQFGLAMFETTFALYAKQMWRYGPAQVGAAFMVCGLVMAVAQTGATRALARRVGELRQIAAGFGLVGASLALLPLAPSTPLVLLAVAALAAGLGLVTPNLATLVSRRAGRRTGATLGAQSAANSLGQVAGTLLGGALFAWRMEAPYLAAAALLLATAAALGWRVRGSHPVAAEAAAEAAPSVTPGR